MIRGSLLPEDITILNLYVSNNTASKYMRSTWGKNWEKSKESKRIQHYSCCLLSVLLATIVPQTSLFFIILTLLRSIGQVFCRIPFSWDLSNVFLCVFGRRNKGVKCHFHINNTYYRHCLACWRWLWPLGWPRLLHHEVPFPSPNFCRWPFRTRFSWVQTQITLQVSEYRISW